MRKIRLGSGSGMWPDYLDPAIEIIEKGNVGYISFDTMAEMTLPGMHKLRFDNSEKGYTDIRNTANNLMPACVKNGVRLISNCGGANPLSAGKIAIEAANKMGLHGTRIATISGDDTIGEECFTRIRELRGKGISFRHLDTDEKLESIEDRIIGMSVYLGSDPIVEALEQGAQVMITGRHTDSAMWCAPAWYEFGWDPTDWDRLAAGVIIGHLAECSGHISGGNSTFWEKIPDLAHLGFPIFEVYENGEAIVTKVEGSGGAVSEATCKEQLLYELHDPANYLSPDAVADVTGLKFQQVGENQVKVSGIKGKPRPETLKACIAYRDEYIGQAFIFYAWPKALAKARRAEEILRERYQMIGIEADEMRFDYIGVDSLHGSLSPEPEVEPNEVGLRIAIKSPREDDILKATRDVYAMGLNGPQGMAGHFHLPPREMIAMWPTLIPREEIQHKLVLTEIP